MCASDDIEPLTQPTWKLLSPWNSFYIRSWILRELKATLQSGLGILLFASLKKVSKLLNLNTTQKVSNYYWDPYFVDERTKTCRLDADESPLQMWEVFFCVHTRTVCLRNSRCYKWEVKFMGSVSSPFRKWKTLSQSNSPFPTLRNKIINEGTAQLSPSFHTWGTWGSERASLKVWGPDSLKVIIIRRVKLQPLVDPGAFSTNPGCSCRVCFRLEWGNVVKVLYRHDAHASVFLPLSSPCSAPIPPNPDSASASEHTPAPNPLHIFPFQSQNSWGHLPEC